MGREADSGLALLTVQVQQPHHVRQVMSPQSEQISIIRYVICTKYERRRRVNMTDSRGNVARPTNHLPHVKYTRYHLSQTPLKTPPKHQQALPFATAKWHRDR